MVQLQIETAIHFWKTVPSVQMTGWMEYKNQSLTKLSNDLDYERDWNGPGLLNHDDII